MTRAQDRAAARAAQATEIRNKKGAEGGTVFNVIATHNPDVAVKKIDENSLALEGVQFESFTKPTELLVSRWNPGYRVTSLSGDLADEAIGLLLASNLTDEGTLEQFRRLLSDPRLAVEIIARLLPRQGVPIKGREYRMSDTMVAKVTAEVLAANFSDFGTSVAVAYSYAITKVLDAMGMVMMAQSRRIVFADESFVVGAETLMRLTLVESLKDIFSTTRISQEVRDLDRAATPDIIGEHISRMFRRMSMSIPEVVLRLQELDIVARIVTFYHLDQQRVPQQLRAHPPLQELAQIANFVVMLDGQSIGDVQYPVDAITQAKDACSHVLELLHKAPSIESISLTKFSEYFGMAPASSSDGIRRGAVVYKVLSQASKMEVADTRKVSDGVEASLLPAEYARPTAIASHISTHLLSVPAAAGLASLIADDLAMATSSAYSDPILVTVQLDPVELKLLAMAKSTAVAFTRNGPDVGPVRIVYGAAVGPTWRMAVSAATPSLAFFKTPEAAVVYTSKMEAVMPTPLPSRQQTIGLEAMADTLYLGDTASIMVDNLATPFRMTLPLESPGGVVSLSLDVYVLGALLGHDSEKYVNEQVVAYKGVREPGVDVELTNFLDIAMTYAASGATILADKAESWLIEHLAPIMVHPAIQQTAERAVNAAVVAAGLDGRSLAPQFKDLYTRAYFGTLLAVLAKFDKVPGSAATDIIPLISMAALSLKAQLMMASLPVPVSAARR